MESAGGRDCAALIDRLRSEAYRFDFFQAVRLLQRAADEQAAAAEQTAAERDLGAGEPVRVAATVPTLMRVTHQASHLLELGH